MACPKTGKPTAIERDRTDRSTGGSIAAVHRIPGDPAMRCARNIICSPSQVVGQGSRESPGQETAAIPESGRGTVAARPDSLINSLN